MDQPRTFSLPVIRGQRFEKGKVNLDNTRFENCSFKNCDVLYSGGPAETSACYFENVRWVFEGQAGTIVTVMQGLGWQIIPPK